MRGHRQRQRRRHGPCEGHGDQVPVPANVHSEASAPNEVELRALYEALDDEYKAWATYDQVIRDHGEVRPFTNIRASEGRHIRALTALLQLAGAAVPPNTWPGRVPRFASVREACEAGVQGEVENAALYERLFALPLQEPVRRVLVRLQRASQERHLAALRRCAERGARSAGPQPPGRGRRHRGGGPL